MILLVGFLVFGALFYFALARLELPLWVTLVASAFMALGLASGVDGIKQRFLAARRINRFLESTPTKESLGDWLKQNGIDPSGKIDDSFNFGLGASLFLATLLLAFYVNPWSPTHPLDYVGLIITNVSMALTVSVIGYRVLERVLDLNTGRAVSAVISSEHEACQDMSREGSWPIALSTRREKYHRDLDLGLWLVGTVLLAILLDRFLPWSPAFYQAHRFVCAFVSILSSGVLSLLVVATLHYAKAKYDFEKKQIFGIALSCLIAPALFGALGGVNHLSSDSTKDVYGFEKAGYERSGGFQTRGQRRENIVRNLFGYITSGHGLASLATGIGVALPFAVAGLGLMGGSRLAFQNYNLAGLVLGAVGLMIWISS